MLKSFKITRKDATVNLTAKLSPETAKKLIPTIPAKKEEE